MKKIIFILVLTPFNNLAQSGGSFTFQSLRLVNNVRTAGLGGYNVSTVGDLSTFFQNPALLDSVSPEDAVFMYNSFFLDINALTAQYAMEIGKFGKFGMGITYINYGNFTETDEKGTEQGNFRGQDYLVALGKAHRVGPFVLGLNVKFIHSGIASYGGSALAFDMGGIYQLANSNFTVGMAISNIGFVFSNFTENSDKLPLQITVGMTFKPEEMPVRFTLTGHNLTDANTEFFDSNDRSNFANEIFKRVSVGGEILLSKNINFLLGYDHNRKQELSLEETTGGTGFSYGFMIRIKKYAFRFSRAIYQAAGGTNYISIQSNLKERKKIF